MDLSTGKIFAILGLIIIVIIYFSDKVIGPIKSKHGEKVVGAHGILISARGVERNDKQAYKLLLILFAISMIIIFATTE
jgi:NADH:ubiquinone oxidoreductase subunit H